MGSLKSHYFVNGISLCGKWGNVNPLGGLELGEAPKPGECTACWKRAKAKRESLVGVAR